MSINNYLCDLASTLVLSDVEKNGINTSVETIKKRLSYYSTNIVEKTVFGSYTRGTILPRKADSNSDIDIMVVFSNPYLFQPQTFLNKLKDFAETYYTKSEIYQSSPTIVLELNHIKFELVPAYKNIYGTYRIPKNSSEWQDIYPNLFNNIGNLIKVVLILIVFIIACIEFENGEALLLIAQTFLSGNYIVGFIKQIICGVRIKNLYERFYNSLVTVGVTSSKQQNSLFSDALEYNL